MFGWFKKKPTTLGKILLDQEKFNNLVNELTITTIRNRVPAWQDMGLPYNLEYSYANIKGDVYRTLVMNKMFSNIPGDTLITIICDAFKSEEKKLETFRDALIKEYGI